MTAPDKVMTSSLNDGPEGSGVPASPSGSQASPGAADASPPTVSIPNARPTSRDTAIRTEGIRKLAAECAAWEGSDDDIDGWARLLSSVSLHGNGYDIAKELDDRHRIDGIDLDLVEILDSASSYIWDAERDAVRAWVSANGIKPTLAAGDRIRTARDGTGRINGIDQEQAYYLLVLDGETEKFKRGGGICVNFEDAELVAPASGIEAATADETRSGSAVGESPAPEGGDAHV